MTTKHGLRGSCPGCQDLAIVERSDGDGEVFWVADGWPDPVPVPGLRDVAIDFCPFCGLTLPAPSVGAEHDGGHGPS